MPTLFKLTPPPKPRKPLTPRDTRKTLFEQLLPCEWRDVVFPLASLQLSFEQDLVEHKYWGVDGASVEATGRGTMKITAEIPFVNGIVPGKNERWRAGELYPDGFRRFLKAFANRETGVLVHPEIGEITCKAHSFETKHDPLRRDGVIVTATWMETVLPTDDGQIAVGDSPVKVIFFAAQNLDSSDTDIRGLAPDMPVFEETFDSLANKLTGAIDKISTTAKLAAAGPGQMLNRIKQVEASVNRARSALGWPVQDSCTRMKLAVHDLPNAITKGGRKTLRYVTRAKTSLTGLLSALPGATIDDLIKLNPTLVSQFELPALTVIRYFAP